MLQNYRTTFMISLENFKDAFIHFIRAVPTAIRPGHERKSSSYQYNRQPESAHIQFLPLPTHSLSAPRYQRRIQVYTITRI